MHTIKKVKEIEVSPPDVAFLGVPPSAAIMQETAFVGLQDTIIPTLPYARKGHTFAVYVAVIHKTLRTIF